MRSGVYPRVCGGTRPARRYRLCQAGLSPRVRGNPRLSRREWAPGRSIPACAGEPSDSGSGSGSGPVYPRVCGGTSRYWPSDRHALGLSPRVRGNRSVGRMFLLLQWSIPACAGEPAASRSLSPNGRVYPRVCGGTLRGPIDLLPCHGLSPRVRGNLLGLRLLDRPRRSIPACAGEPPFLLSQRGAARVYPRVCGGTSTPGRPAAALPGLSPRVRGNQAHARAREPVPGSIPACAGEPALWPAWCPSGEVYPRVCGGTIGYMAALLTAAGLSPRVRGNPVQVEADDSLYWSIPACAGEPCTTTALARWGAVYPRVCGGTSRICPRPSRAGGLSPRVRGNPIVVPKTARKSWSIPACAGEPLRLPPSQSPSRVYPRVCGGTPPSSFWFRTGPGLSPRVRGNRRRRGVCRHRGGSIPACAGEPECHRGRGEGLQVYPRVCGGTGSGSGSGSGRGGLSPRVRGNHCRHDPVAS